MLTYKVLFSNVVCHTSTEKTLLSGSSVLKIDGFIQFQSNFSLSLMRPTNDRLRRSYGDSYGYGFDYSYSPYPWNYPTYPRYNVGASTYQRNRLAAATTTTQDVPISNVRYFQIWNQGGQLRVGDHHSLKRQSFPLYQYLEASEKALSTYGNEIPIAKHCVETSEPLNKTTYLVVSVHNPDGHSDSSIFSDLRVSHSHMPSLFMLDRIITNESTISAHYSTSVESWRQFSAECNCHYAANFSGVVLGKNSPAAFTEKVFLNINFDYVQINGISMRRLPENEVTNWNFQGTAGQCLVTCHACFCNHDENEFTYDWFISTEIEAFSKRNQLLISTSHCEEDFQIHCTVRLNFKFQRTFIESSSNLRYRMENKLGK